MHPAIFTLAVLFTLIEVDNAENPQDVSLTTQCMPGAECDVALNFVQKGQRSEKASIHEQHDMEAKTECSADFGEDKACCGQPGDWWAAENNYPNGLRNCPQNEPICDGYQEYLKMGICKAKTECSANFGETQACCGQALSNRRLRNCPQNEPICHDYKDNVKMGICRAEVKIRCSADFGEEKACCGQLGDWWAAERKKIFPNGLRNCPQNQPICDDYKEYVKMGICRAKADFSCENNTVLTLEKSKYPSGDLASLEDLKNSKLCPGQVGKQCKLDFVNPSDLCKLSNGQVGGKYWRYRLRKKTRRRKFRCYIRRTCKPLEAYDSCDGKTEGQPCQQCDPSNKDCMETAVMKTCQKGECRPSKAYDSCDGKTEGQPCQQCDPSNKDCMETAVMKTCQKGECRPSKAAYDPCGGKTEGQLCQQCDPSNKDCMETGDVKTCQEGECRPSKKVPRGGRRRMPRKHR